MHFPSELFDSHPKFIQLKSILLDFFVGQAIEAIHVAGIEHIISVTLAPTLTAVDTSGQSLSAIAESSAKAAEHLPKTHIRTHTLKFHESGGRAPKVELIPMGPSLDLNLSRNQEADPDL